MATTKLPDMSEALQMMIRGELPPPPVSKLIGFRLVKAEKGSGAALFTLAVGEQHHNPMGTLHGGVVIDVADAAMGCAFATTIAAGETYTTIELHANYFKPVRAGVTVTASAKVVKKTKSIGLVECDVTDEGGSLVARVSSTCMILRGEQAAGR